MKFFCLLTIGFFQVVGLGKTNPETIITPIEWIKPPVKSPLVKKHTDLWLDVDPGHGDGIAVFMGIYHKAFTVHGITATQGNTSGPNALRNLRILLSLFHKPEIPIYQGAQIALTAYTYHYKDSFHGTEGFPQSQLEKAKVLSQPEPVGTTIHSIYTKIMSLKNNITYMVAGPATTIALLIRSFPEVLKKIDRIIYMGAGTTHGNVTPFAEFNTYNDPESLYISLNAPVESIIFPLEGLEDISYDKSHVKKVREANEHMGYVLGELFDEIITASLEWNQPPNSYDDGLFPVMVKEGYCKNMRTASWDILLDGEKRGMTVFKWLDEYDRPEVVSPDEKFEYKNRHTKTLVKVCTGTRREFLWEMLFDILAETKDVHHGFVHSLRQDEFIKGLVIFIVFFLICWLVGYLMYGRMKARWDKMKVRQMVGDVRIPDRVEWGDESTEHKPEWNKKIQHVREME